MMVCETCGAAEWWCLDKSNQVWVLCSDESCTSRAQLEMFESELDPDWWVPEGSERDDLDAPRPR